MPSSPLSETKDAAGARARGREALQRCSRPRMRRYFGPILKSGSGAGSGAGIQPHPNRRTPDHPPYSEMVEVALQALAEENGSTVSTISAYIKSRFTDVPWGHDRLLPYYLRKLVVAGELISPSLDRYQICLHPPTLLSSVPPPLRRRGRPPLHPPNPNFNPSFNPLSSAPSRRRGRSRLYRRGGRLPKILAEGMPPLHLGQESRPLRRRRGRPPIRRDHALSGIDLKIEGSVSGVLGDPEGNSFVAPDQFLTGKEPSFLAPETSKHGEEQPFRNAEGSGGYCTKGNNGGQSLISEIGDGKKNGGSTSDVLEHGEGQSLPGEEIPFVATEQFSPGKEPPFLAPELSEHGEGQPFRNVEGCYYSEGNVGGQLGISAFDDDKKNGGSESGALEDPEQPEQGRGQSLPGEGQPFVSLEQSGYGEGQFSPQQVPPILVSEHSEHRKRKRPQRRAPPSRPQRRAPPSVPPEQTEPNQDQSLPGEGLSLLLPEQSEHGHGLSLAPEESEDGNEQRSQGEGTALVAPMEGELVLIEKVENAAFLSNKRRRQERRRLRLWFEG